MISKPLLVALLVTLLQVVQVSQSREFQGQLPLGSVAFTPLGDETPPPPVIEPNPKTPPGELPPPSSSPRSKIIADQYIVVLKTSSEYEITDLYVADIAESFITSEDSSAKILAKYHINPRAVISQLPKDYYDDDYNMADAPESDFTPFAGFAINCSAKTLAKIKAHHSVAYVENDGYASITGALQQSNSPWNLARLSQRNLPIAGNYIFDSTMGGGVHAFVLDTGVYPANQDFEGRVQPGANFITTEDSNDHNGHGTHVAGILASHSFGVAKKALIIPVKVLDGSGTGSWSGILSGIQWMVNYHSQTHIRSVANLSVHGGLVQSINDAIKAAVDSYIHFAVAAGNENTDACQGSPGAACEAAGCLTVGNSDINDKKASDSNYGSCVTIWAPGSGIISLWNSGTTATMVMSGTSMASPHVAGVMAAYLAVKNFRTWAMKKNLLGSATPNHLSNIQNGSPNSLLFEDPLGCSSCAQTMMGITNEASDAAATTGPVVSSESFDLQNDEEERDMDDGIIDKVVDAVKTIVKESHGDMHLGENRKIRFKMSWLIKKSRKTTTL